MSTVLRTDRLVVREWEPHDAPHLFDMFRRPEVSRWTSLPEPMAHVSEAEERIALYREAYLRHPGLGLWAVVPGGSDRPLGSVLIRPLGDGPEVEIGWSLHPDAWGKGYATEGALAVLRRAFDLGHEHVLAIMWPDNHPSAAVATRIGMVDLGEVDDPWYGTPEEPTSRMFRADAATWTDPDPA